MGIKTGKNGVMESWNDGIVAIKNGKHITFGSGAPRLSITEFTLRNEGPEAQGKIFLAFSLKPAADGCLSKLD